MASPLDQQPPGDHLYEGIWYHEVFAKEALDRVKTFAFRDDDTVLVAYPKSGMTWMGQILHLVSTAGKNPEAYMAETGHSVPYLEMKPLPKMGLPMYMDICDQEPSPRRMKSHLEVKFFQRVLESNRKTKFVVIMRNVKDVLVSYYHFYRANVNLGQFKGSFGDWMELYKHQRMQDWFDWNMDWWQRRDHPNVIFFKFEDMKKDLQREVVRLVDFLGLKLSEQELQDICDQTSFGSMSKAFEKLIMVNKIVDPKISPFMRSGEVGDWKNYFDDDLNRYIDNLYDERVKGSGLEFDFE